jgi:hypothetical protein
MLIIPLPSRTQTAPAVNSFRKAITRQSSDANIMPCRQRQPAHVFSTNWKYGSAAADILQYCVGEKTKAV